MPSSSTGRLLAQPLSHPNWIATIAFGHGFFAPAQQAILVSVHSFSTHSHLILTPQTRKCQNIIEKKVKPGLPCQGRYSNWRGRTNNGVDLHFEEKMEEAKAKHNAVNERVDWGQ